MKKPLALFDIDNTMFDGLSFFPLMDAQVKEGLIDSSVSEQAYNSKQRYKEHSLGYEDFIKELLDIYAEGLQNKSEMDVEESTNRFFNQSSAFFAYVEPTINLLSNTHEVVLVTGSSHFTAKAVAKVFGVSSYISTELGVKDGILTGKVKSYLATRHEKKDAIRHLTERHLYAGSFGFGDSEGDIEMLQVIEHAICIRPTSGLTDIAIKHGWTIVESQDELGSNQGLSAVKHVLAE